MKCWSCKEGDMEPVEKNGQRFLECPKCHATENEGQKSGLPTFGESPAPTSSKKRSKTKA